MAVVATHQPRRSFAAILGNPDSTALINNRTRGIWEPSCATARFGQGGLVTYDEGQPSEPAVNRKPELSVGLSPRPEFVVLE